MIRSSPCGAPTDNSPDSSTLSQGAFTYSESRGFIRAFRKFPVSLALAAPYAVLIIPQAIWNQNEHLSFILGVFAIAILGSLTVELIVNSRIVRMRKLPPGRSSRDEAVLEKLRAYGPALRRSGWIVSIIGTVVGIVAAMAGIGSVQSQIGILKVSAPLAMVSSLVGGWQYVGAALLIAAFMARQISSKNLWVWLGVVAACQVFESYLTGITASLISFVITMTMVLLITGVMKLRFAVLAILLMMIAWPIVFEIRNEIRVSSGVAVNQEVDAFDRLRFDEQIARAADIRDIPLELGQPGPLDMVRYGLIPRALDSDRPALSTGIKINMFLGGTATSAYTFLPVTTIYVLSGPTYLAIWYGFWAFLTFLTIRRGYLWTPARIVILTLILTGPLGWFSTFPDRSIGILQYFVSFLPVLFILTIEKYVRQGRRLARYPGVAEADRVLGD